MLVDITSRTTGRTNGPRVAVIDDDDAARHGVAAVLAAAPGVGSVVSASHDAAASWRHEWSTMDVAIVDAVDERRSDDNFPGVRVVEGIRAMATLRPPTIIVVTPWFFDDALRRRMREAHADFFYPREELADRAVLLDAVLRPGTHHRPVPGPTDPECQFRHGVTSRSRVNRGVRFALSHELHLAPAHREAPRGRRWLRLRQEFNDEARLNPVTSDGRLPDRPQVLPSLPQIARFLDWATHTKPLPGNALRLDRPLSRAA